MGHLQTFNREPLPTDSFILASSYSHLEETAGNKLLLLLLLPQLHSRHLGGKYVSPRVVISVE